MSDPVLLITGASSGIGAATARAASAAGHRLVLAARSQDRLEALAAELGGDERALAVRADVCLWEDNRRMADAAIEHFGQIDAVFANAGFGGRRTFVDEDADSPEFWREMVLTNVLGCAYTVRATLSAIRERRGHIVLMSSVAGRVPTGSLYSGTKFAVTGIGRSLRTELLGSGVRVTLIEPGFVDTPFFTEPPEMALSDQDIARSVMYALEQPPHVDVSEILIRPTGQDL
ncbi:unannotated protein [freshwater metagenome]|uniref:Unannotated protein n=1 Tax=freshwater metagenome TaxID=449393 RepID=A0A6J7CFE5_9ZZZZ|nr:SDR family NAD(P)-dependent oxidoreductase [Actinomycetota bacterium]